MKIIKFHLGMQIPENILDFGVTAHVDTRPPKSNHKKNTKQPCRLTQQRAEHIELQTAHHYFENVVMDFAGAALDTGCTGNSIPNMKFKTSNLLHTHTYVKRVPDSKQQGSTTAIAIVTNSETNNSYTNCPVSPYTPVNSL